MLAAGGNGASSTVALRIHVEVMTRKKQGERAKSFSSKTAIGKGCETDRCGCKQIEGER